MRRELQLIGLFAKKHAWQVSAAGLTGWISNLLTLLIPLGIGRFYQLIGSEHESRSVLLGFLPINLGDSLTPFFFSFLGLLLLRYIIQVVHKSLQGSLGERFVASLREHLFLAHLYASPEVYQEKGKGRFLLRFSGSMGSSQRLLTKGCIQFSADLVLVFVLVALLNELLPWRALGLLGLYAMLCFALLWITSSFLKDAHVRRNDYRSSLLAYISRKIQVIEVTQVFHRQIPEFRRFERKSTRVSSVGSRYQLRYGLHHAFAPFMVHGSLLLLMLIYVYPELPASFRQAPGTVEDHAYLTAMLLILFTGSVWRRLLRIPGVWKPGLVALNKLTTLLQQSAVEYSGSAVFLQSKRERSVRLPSSGRLVLHQARVVLPDQSTVELVECSTEPGTMHTLPMARRQVEAMRMLLMGRWMISSGEAILGNHPIADLSPDSLRQCFTYISPVLPLSGETVLECISYSRDPKSRSKAQQIWDQCQTGLAEDERLALSKKIIDNGQYLSLDLQCRLQIARAMLTNKRIVWTELPVDQLNTEDVLCYHKILSDYAKLRKASVILVTVQ